MTPREIAFAVLLAEAREARQKSDALTVAALGANDPKNAIELAKTLTG
jgi:hypothetical protein